MKEKPARIMQLIAAAAFLLLLMNHSPALADGSVVITAAGNPALYTALHNDHGLDADDNGEITDDELSGLGGGLNLSGEGISNIEGLEHCTHITSLTLTGNPITNFPADMSAMTLARLVLDDVPNLGAATNLTAIAGLLNLQALDISSSDITDVSFLSAASNLYFLAWNLNGSLDIDLSSLSGLPQLTSLEMYNNTGFDGDLTPIAGMTNLTVLNIANCHIRSLGSLSALAHLEWLNASGNYITDVSPLTGMPIKSLYIINNYLDITAGSEDRLILDTLESTVLQYDTQRVTTLTYDAAPGTPARPSDTLYYGQSTTLPTAMPESSDYVLKGWDINNDGLSEYKGGETIAFLPPVLPVPGNEVIYKAVYRAASSLSVLSGLDCTQPLSPSFNESCYEYNITLPKNVSSVTITPSVPEFTTFTIAAQSVPAKTISVGNGQTVGVSVVTTAEDGHTDTKYNITIYREPLGSTCRLAGISLSTAALALSPEFSPECASYSIALPKTTGSVTITPATSADATFTLDGSAVASKAFNINNGATKKVDIVVTSEDEMNHMTYTVTITRAPLDSSSALTGIALSPPALSLSPAFSATCASYSVALPKTTGSVTITPTAPAGTTLTLDGTTVASKTFDINNGTSKAVDIVVTSEDGASHTTYTVTITRAPLDSASALTGIALSPPALSLSPAFSPTQMNYSVTLPVTDESVTITPQIPATAAMTIDGQAAASKVIAVYYGETATVAIAVTAEDGSSRSTYSIAVTRAKPDAAKLQYLGNSTGTLSPVFSPYKTSYTLTLPEGAKSVTLKPVKAVSSSKLYINNKQVSSKTYKLDPGKSTKATLKVVSASGAKCTYTVTIKRSASTNANLKSLSAGAALSPQFDAGVAEYTVKVPKGKASVTVKTVKADKNATVYINGKKAASKNIKVKNGQTVTVTVTVKAQAGNTKTYKLVLSRPPNIKTLKATPLGG